MSNISEKSISEKPIAEKELISVIVPIYKVEKYLEQCVDSIIAQTYQNLQIVLVDDGSPDRCGEICDRYASENKNIVVIHKKNGGLSDARNAGIQAASGAWLAFIDSDDFIDPDMMETLYNLAVSNQAKMAWCAVREVEEGAEYRNFFLDHMVEKERTQEQINVYSPVEAEKQFYTMNKQQCVITCNKLFHRSIFDEISFPVGKLYEDGYTFYRTIYIAEKVVTTTAHFYYYRQRSGSIMEKNSDRIYVPSLEAGQERIEFYTAHGEKELRALEINLELYLAIHFYQVMKDKKEKKKIKDWYRRIYQEYFVKEKWPLAKRIRMKAFLVGNPLYLMISRFEGVYNKLRGKQER